ncbi:hypothetical protein [Haliangium sp.]|uniref:hypothetical protein n=1 Tax=Haliangium sp. TaxID=2663208 RepID=UPI003D144B85
MKVRLVRPLVVEIAQLDVTASEFDPDFQEPRRGARRERPPIHIPAQVEDATHERLLPSPSGNLPDSRLVLVMDCDDLAGLGLIEPGSNQVALRVGDRLVRLLNGAGAVIEVFPFPPGVFITELRPTAGLDRDRNLLLAYCHDREQGLSRGV